MFVAEVLGMNSLYRAWMDPELRKGRSPLSVATVVPDFRQFISSGAYFCDLVCVDMDFQPLVPAQDILSIRTLGTAPLANCWPGPGLFFTWWR
jgi:hypothetical protein